MKKIFFSKPWKLFFPGFFTQIPETRILNICPEIKTLVNFYSGWRVSGNAILNWRKGMRLVALNSTLLTLALRPANLMTRCGWQYRMVLPNDGGSPYDVSALSLEKYHIQPRISYCKHIYPIKAKAASCHEWSASIPDKFLSSSFFFPSRLFNERSTSMVVFKLLRAKQFPFAFSNVTLWVQNNKSPNSWQLRFHCFFG